MSVFRVVALIILMAIFLWAGQASAGWVLDQVLKGRITGRSQMMVQANRTKTVTFGESGRPTMAVILDLNAGTITQVNYEERTYSSATLQEYVQAMQQMQQMATGQMAEAMKQMQEQLKNMPPEQRKAVEEMMRSQGAQVGPTAQECREPRVEIRKTGQQATIAGYAAVRYDLLTDGKLTSELWLTKGITVWRELDLKKLEQFTRQMQKLAGCGPGGAQPGFAQADLSLKAAAEGYPVRMVDPTGGGWVTEVVKAESRSLSTAEFQPPAGFARKPFSETMGERRSR